MKSRYRFLIGNTHIIVFFCVIVCVSSVYLLSQITIKHRTTSIKNLYDHSSVVFLGDIWVLGGRSAFEDSSRIFRSSDGFTWKEVFSSSSRWSPRSGHTSVVFKDKIWVMGGSDGKRLFSDVWCSSDGTQWSKVMNSAPWQPRSNHASVVFDNKIWVIGGQGDDKDDPNLDPYIGDVWCSEDGIHWQKIVSNAPWKSRWGQAVVVYDRAIWIVGGWGRGSYPVAYDGTVALDANGRVIRAFPHDVWKSRNGSDWEQVIDEGPWVTYVNHSLTVFSNKMWIIGGDALHTSPSDSPQFLKDVMYSTDGKTWRKALLPPWKERCGHSSLVYRDKLWIIFGKTKGKMSDIWSSRDGEEWERVSDMSSFP